MKNPKSKLWGGRFTRATHETIERFTHSLAVDQRLARYDLLGSIAHAKMLGKTGIIPQGDSNALVKALQILLKQLGRGHFKPDPSAEDIHTAIQFALEKKLGSRATVLHTARSRNDQVVTAFRLYCVEQGVNLNGAIRSVQREILRQAERTQDFILPGYTHLRHAQPVLLSHVLLSYMEMLERDRGRLWLTAGRAVYELPLGSGALVGTGLPINQSRVAKELGFLNPKENSIDGVSDRDFVVEFLSALSLLSVHLSRIAEELIIWSTAEFGFLRFDEQVLTGSSMMPQKQNPDFLELTRAGSARIIGNLSAMLTLLKGLPSGYQRDLQLDKEILFEAVDRMEGMLAVLAVGFHGIRWSRQAMAAQLKDESLYATDLAEYLVTKGVPFAQAHRSVGQLLSHADRTKTNLKTMPLAVYRKFSTAFGQDVVRLLDPAVSVQRKRSVGSTNPAQVRRQIRRWKSLLKG